MKTYSSVLSFRPKKKTVVTIGTFDGVHIGHRKIINRINTIADEKNLESTLLTFFPHPRMVLQHDQTLQLIHTIEERQVLLAQAGLNHLIIEPFTIEFSRLEAKDYVEKFLVNQLHAAIVVVGYDHRFGHHRKAGIEELKHYASLYDFEVEEIPEQDINDITVSSTKIRKAIADGNIDIANSYLTKPFSLSGQVVKGRQLGNSLGYPTANIHIKDKYKIIPKSGSYIVRSVIENKTYFGMMNIGHNPTVNDSDNTFIETHFFDFDKNIYHTSINIDILKRIRDEIKFDTINALQKALQEDEYFSKQYIRKYV